MRAGVYGRQSAAKEKSIAQQLDLGEERADDNGWTIAARYRDGRSASRFGKQARGGWAQVRADVKAKAFDVLILWESSRGDRTLTEWSAFLDDCRDHGVQVHVIKDDTTYNLSNARHWKTLAEDGIANAYESELISQRVLRGQKGSAKDGRPSHGPAPYGYRRVYDPTTGELLGQEPHPDQAPIVQEIITRLSQSEPVNVVTADLNARQVPTMGAARWYRMRVRDLALNRAYVGLRVHNGTTRPGTWPALVTPEVFWAANRILTAPERQGVGVKRPGRQRYLLSYLATCACGAEMSGGGGRYRCRTMHNSVRIADLDELITELAIQRLSDPEVYAALRQANDAAASAAAEADAEIGRLNDQLEQWRASAAAGETTPASLAAIERGLQERIDIAQKVVDAAPAADVLDGWLGPRTDVEARWAAAGVPARRTVLRALRLRVEVRLSTDYHRGRKAAPIQDRVHADFTSAS